MAQTTTAAGRSAVMADGGRPSSMADASDSGPDGPRGDVQPPAGLPLAVRPLVATDLGLVLQTWLRSHRHGSHLAWGIPSPNLYRGHERLVRSIMARPGALGLAACLRDDPVVVVGWVLVEPALACVHFAYTKEAWRRAGVCRTLLAAAGLSLGTQPLVATATTGRATAPGGPFSTLRVTFDPYLLLD